MEFKEIVELADYVRKFYPDPTEVGIGSAGGATVITVPRDGESLSALARARKFVNHGAMPQDVYRVWIDPYTVREGFRPRGMRG